MLVHRLTVAEVTYLLADCALVEHWTRQKMGNALLTHHALLIRQTKHGLRDILVDLRDGEGVRVADPVAADSEGAWKMTRALDEGESKEALRRLVALAAEKPSWRWTYNCEDFVSQVATGQKGSVQRLVIGGLAALLGLRLWRDNEERERRNARRRAQRRRASAGTRRQLARSSRRRS